MVEESTGEKLAMKNLFVTEVVGGCNDDVWVVGGLRYAEGRRPTVIRNSPEIHSQSALALCFCLATHSQLILTHRLVPERKQLYR